MSDTNRLEQDGSAALTEDGNPGVAKTMIEVTEENVSERGTENADVAGESVAGESVVGESVAGKLVADSSDDNDGVAEGLMAVSEELRPGALEALLFASGEPVPLHNLCRLIGATKVQTEDALKRLSDNLAELGRGVELVEVAGRFQLRTKQSFGAQIRVLRAEKPKRLSPAALETLAIVAYRQPVVKSDIERIRGVDTTPTVKTLIERGLIQIVGHQQTVGSPALYGTTEEFLKVFGLKDLAALPTLREVGMIEAEPGDDGEEDEQSVEKNGQGQRQGQEQGEDTGTVEQLAGATGAVGEISGGSQNGIQNGSLREVAQAAEAGSA